MMANHKNNNAYQEQRKKYTTLVEEGNILSVMFCGVGGQGIILATTVLARAVQLAGYDVKVSEVHGMAQRGGSVVGSVRLGRKVFSPTIGKADFIVALEKLEAVRYRGKLAEDGFILINDQEIVPVSMFAQKQEYPHQILSDVEKTTTHYRIIKAMDIAQKLGQPRVLNTVLLGFLSNFLPIDEKCWIRAVKQTIPEKAVHVNLQAFSQGQKY